MRYLPVLILMCVTATAAGAWPTLAHRAVEGPAAKTADGPCAAAQPATCGPATSSPLTPQPLPPTASVEIGDVPARLAVIDRDVADAASRLAAQRARTSAAVAAARGMAEASPAWTQAQIEQTALDRIGNQLTDLRSRLDGVAGTLAAADAGGSEVGIPLQQTGRLIARVSLLQADYSTAGPATR